MSKKTKDFNLQEFLDKQRIRKLFKKATVFLVLAVLIGGFVGVWSTGVIQKAIYNSQDLPDYVSYVDHTHSYKKTVVEPTCTEQGYTLYECRYCDMSYKQDYTATIDHDYQEVVLEQATTTSYGKAELVCSMCGDVKYEITLPLVGHTFASEVVEPTCTEDGYTIHRSTDTDDMYIDEVIPATGHSMRLKDNYFYCETCGVMEYIEDCAASGYVVVQHKFWYDEETGTVSYYNSINYCYVDTEGTLCLAGNQHGLAYAPGSIYGQFYVTSGDESLFEAYTKVVFLEDVTDPGVSDLADTVKEVEILGELSGEVYSFGDSIETVVIDAECDSLDLTGYGIKNLSISGKVKCVSGITCPNLETIELGEGIEEFYGGNFGKVEVIILPHSVKECAVDCDTCSVEYLEAKGNGLYCGFDWSAYLGEGVEVGQSPETYLAEKESIETYGTFFVENGVTTWVYDYESLVGYTYEECVVAWEAYTAYMAALESTCNEPPICVIQEGTESVSLGDGCIVFLPSTIKEITTTIGALIENNNLSASQIYYAGSQTDALTVTGGSNWLTYVVAYNATYSRQ